MNYIERLLESQYANDELKDYLNANKKVKDSPKMHQKYKIPVSPTSHKNASRNAQSILNAPNANRLSVVLNAKFKFNKINALAKPDKKYTNLVWILCTEKNKNVVMEYLNQKMKLQQDGNMFNIGSKFQIRCTNIDKKGVQNYFIAQNGAEFVDDIEKLTAKDETEASDENNDETSNSGTAKQQKHDDDRLAALKASDPYRDDIIGYDPKENKPIYRPWSEGWRKQQGQMLRDKGIDISKWNLDPTKWDIFQSLKKAS